ncbi:MAG: LPS assembly lipoprotein LptE [Verrucomicrobiales bacterium]|nr:LPS assembly lipoprotein LptE [Verrucomicrobiales bacterium]
MNRSLFAFLFLTGAALLISGCAGYQLGEVKPSALAGIDRIHVPPFKNSTLEPRLSSLVTNAVLKEIQADGTYKVTNRTNCDAILVGEITRIQKSQLRAVRNDTLQSQELSVYLYIEYHLEDPATGQRIDSTATPSKYGSDEKSTGDEDVYLSRQGAVTGRTIQFVDPSFQVGERNALSVAAQDAATKLVSQIADGW